MKLALKFILIILFLLNFCQGKDILLDNPIDLNIDNNKGLNEFYKKYINNVDIEKFIKEQIKGEYVPVGLDECLRVALLNNFDIKIKEHEFKSSKYEYHYSLAKFLPDFSTNSYLAHYAGQILVGGVLSDGFDETAISVSLAVTHDLTKGGQEIFEAKAAKYFSKAKNHNVKYTITEVLYLTAKYYYETLLAKINIEIYLKNYIERNAQLEIAKSQEKAGFGTHFDVIRSESESLDAKSTVLDSLRDFKIAQAKLVNIMGIEITTLIMPFEDEIRELNLIDETKTVDDLFKIAITNREDLKRNSALIDYEKQIKNVYIADFIPKPYVTFHQQFQGTVATSVYPNYYLGGYIDWKPGEYLSFGTISKIKKQNETIKVKKLELENKIRDIKRIIISSYTASILLKKQITNNKQRVDYANESIKLAMMRFNYGKGILLDIIQAQGEITSARVQYAASIINYNLVQLELLFNSGEITADEIIKNYKP